MVQSVYGTVYGAVCGAGHATVQAVVQAVVQSMVEFQDTYRPHDFTACRSDARAASPGAVY